MYSCLNKGDIDSFTIEQLQICVLLFTDDTTLLSYTKQGMQTLLNNLSNYCSKCGIEVNTDKIVVVVFKRGNRQEQLHLFIKKIKLKVVESFTYLVVLWKFL